MCSTRMGSTTNAVATFTVARVYPRRSRVMGVAAGLAQALQPSVLRQKGGFPNVQERYLGRMEPGMDVCDMNGDKVGSVARVYRHEMAAVAAGAGPGGGGSLPEAPTSNEILEVKTGFLGLGRRLYVPLD